MTNELKPAHQEILDDYLDKDLQVFNEIANHGCKSGICSKHIYYTDTISFFDKHEDEVVNYLAERLGEDYLTELFNQSRDVGTYKNDCTWSFIEFIAMDVIDADREYEYQQDEVIGSYYAEPDYTLADSVTDAASTLMVKSGMNPPKSLNLERYNNV